MLIDSHAHLDHSRFAGDLDALLARAWASGVGTILSIGIGEGPSTMDGALRLARAYRAKPQLPTLWATAGVHPQDAGKCDTLALANLHALLDEPEVLACGEIGLDFFHPENPPVAQQREAFRAQMELAAAHRKPVVIHCRPGEAFGPEADAWQQTLSMLEETWRPTGLGGILHCFSGSQQDADRALGLGFLVSFAGNLTYPAAGALRAVAAALPPESLLVETDCPFLAPVPERGKRNEPALVGHTAAVVAQVRGVSAEALARQTSANFFSLFDGARPAGNPDRGPGLPLHP